MDIWYFHITWEIGIWLGSAMLGIGLNIFMINQARLSAQVAGDAAEKRIVLSDQVQWWFGFTVKMLGFLFGFWIILLPYPPGTEPEIGLQQFAREHGRTIITWSLLLMMIGMDIRDGVLVFINTYSRRQLRKAIKNGASNGTVTE